MGCRCGLETLAYGLPQKLGSQEYVPCLQCAPSARFPGCTRLLPRHCASSARTSELGAQANLHCTHRAWQNGLNREKCRFPHRARRARPAKVWTGASPRNIAHATTPRCWHRWTLATLLSARANTCIASPFTPEHLRPVPAPQLHRWASRCARCSRIANFSIPAGTVGERGRDLASRARSAHIVSLSNRRPSPRPARALEAAASLGKGKCAESKDFPLGQVDFL